MISLEELFSLLLLIWTSIAVSTDTSDSLSPINNEYTCQPPSGCIGAVYFATNNELGNWVVVNCIQPDGTLLFNNTISTQGNGSSHVNQYPFVNYMITGDNFLFVANSGSNTVSMFTIDPNSPEKLTFVRSVKSQGNFPACLAYSSELEVLCVLNIGLINNVACFKVTQTCLIPLPNTIKPVGKSQPNPPRYEESPTDFKFSADSTKVIVSVRGRERSPKVPSVLAVFNVSSQGTVLSDPVLNPILALNPIELTLIPPTIKNCSNINQQPMIYTSSRPTGFGLFTVPSSGIIEQGLIVNKSIPGNLHGAGWSKFSTKTGKLYTTDDGSRWLTETKIVCWNDGEMTGFVYWQYLLHEEHSEFLFAIIPSGEFLYSMTSRRGGSRPIVKVFRMGTESGNLTPIQSYAPDSEKIRAQTGQSLQIFCQGIAAFVAQPQVVEVDL